MSTVTKELIKPEEMKAVDVSNAIGEAWAAFINSDNRPSTKRANVYATGFRECDRQMVLDMVAGDQMPSFDADTLARFRRGNDRERDMMADLKKIGRNCDPRFEVQGEQERFEIKDRKGRVIITGKIDGRLMFPDYKILKFLHGQRSTPIEAKAWNANLVARIQDFEDLFNSRWTKTGAYQILMYVFSENTPLGFLLLDRSGLPALIPVELYSHLEKVEKFMLKAEKAMDHKEAGTFPDYTTQKEECKFCPHFGRTCNPPISYGEGAKVFTDEDTITRAERYIELERHLSDEEWTEYNRLDKWAKDQFRGVETGIVGGLLISGKWQNMTKVVVPEEQQAEFNARKIAFEDYVKTFSVKDPKGKFAVMLTRVIDLKPVEAKAEKAPAAPAAAEKPKRKKKADAEPAGA